jgi:hypothetical protein
MLSFKLCQTNLKNGEIKRDVPFELCQLAAYKQYSATHSLPTNSLHRQAGGRWGPVPRGTGI